MTLLEKLNSIYRPAVPDLAKGEATSIEEFWDDVVKPVLPRKECVLAWNELLMEYVTNELNPCFALRGYNSFPKNQYSDLRRGFLTNTDTFSFFYTDNYFAAYFQKMVIDGFVPTKEEFAQALKNRKFPSRFGQNTREEKELMAIAQGKDPRINSSGYKLAHIIPVGKDYLFNGRNMGSKYMLDTYFPKGERNDWKIYQDEYGQFYARHLDVDDSIAGLARAHFLRFVHPFNYFLCPKQKCETNNKCKELAEYQPLLDYAHDYMLSTYGDAYREYLDYVLSLSKYESKCFDSRKSLIQISYGKFSDDYHDRKRIREIDDILNEVNHIQKALDELKRKASANEDSTRWESIQKRLDSLKQDAQNARMHEEQKTNEASKQK